MNPNLAGAQEHEALASVPPRRTLDGKSHGETFFFFSISQADASGPVAAKKSSLSTGVIASPRMFSAHSDL